MTFAVLTLFGVMTRTLIGSLSPLLLILTILLVLGNTVRHWQHSKNTKFVSDAPAIVSIMLAICFSGLIADSVPLRGGTRLAVFAVASWVTMTIPFLAAKVNISSACFFGLVNCIVVAFLPYGAFRAQAKRVEEARHATCVGDMRHIYQTIEKYKSSHAGAFPSPNGWREALEPLMPGYFFGSFHCSFHSNPVECYLYTPPKTEKKGNPVILSCHHSKVIFLDPETICLRKDGTIEVVRGSPPRVVQEFKVRSQL